MKTLLGQYKEVLERKEFQAENAEYGHMLCVPSDNPKGKILFTGINPSLGKGGEQDNVPFKLFSGNFWKPVIDLAGNLVNDIAYIDLFPLRKTKQDKFEQLGLDFKGRILEVTQKEIERLEPKLIVVLNASSKHYWGPEGWMGYSFEESSFEPVHGKLLYKITGFNPDCKNRINPGLTKSHLKGTYIYFYRMLSSRYEMNLSIADRLSHKDIENLWSWVKKHTPSLVQ